MITNTPFIISEEIEGNMKVMMIKNNLTGEYVSIIPDFGARPKELWLKSGDRIISILKNMERINPDNPDELFANAKLSPFAGRIKNGRYKFNNIIYSLPLNFSEQKESCHGFIYDKKFDVVNKTIEEKYAVCALEYFYDSVLEGYPYAYLISIEYRLTTNNGLIINTKIVNCSNSIMPISDGWHFYFELGEKVDDLKLKLDVTDEVELNQELLPTGNITKYNDFNISKKIGIRLFDSVFRVNNNKDKSITHLTSEKSNADLQIWQTTGFHHYNYLIVYIPENRKSIAIEPITSNVNSFNNREGLILLKPKKEFISSCGIAFGSMRDIL